jgi:hypothetical protein
MRKEGHHHFRRKNVNKKVKLLKKGHQNCWPHQGVTP